MDWKTAWARTAHATNTGLDALTPACAPFAARWDAEADRRRQLRTTENFARLMDAHAAHNSTRTDVTAARKQVRAAWSASKNPLSSHQRSARMAHKLTRLQHAEVKAELKDARVNHPTALVTRAAQAHAVHAVPGGICSLVMSEQAHALVVWPGAVSLCLVGLHAAALWLGRRGAQEQPVVEVDDGLSAEERRLVERLEPSYWVENADARGLAGTLTTPAEVTEAGLVSHVRLDAKWTPKAFRAKADEVRALLGARSDLRVEIKAGSHGDRATLTLRTRNAAEGADLSGWQPGDPWGIDTVTGEPVTLPLGRRMLVAGASGSGKSWSTRSLLAEASEYDDHRLVVFDRKRVEALNWEHRARTAVVPDDMLELSDELAEEMHDRLAEIPRGQDVIAISPARPRITVFVDEGAEAIAVSGQKGFDRLLENFRTLARMGRAAEIILIWATQKPTMTGPGYGIDSQIAAQITVRAALYLSTATESRTVFGEDAIEKGWHAHELPEKGHALLRVGAKGKTNPVRTRAFSPSDVIALPDRPIWERGQAPADQGPNLSLVKSEAPTVELPAVAGTETNRDRVLKAVYDGARTARDIVDRTGIHKGTISREIKALISAGSLRKADDGMLLPEGETA